MGPSTISATWTLKRDPANDPHMYELNYEVIKTETKNVVQSGSLPLDATSLTASGLEPSTEYNISVTTVGLYSRNTATFTAKTVRGGKKRLKLLLCV